MASHLLTGAGSGIGRVVAERLRDRGDRLVLVVRSKARVEELQPDFPRADFVIADLAEPALLGEIGSVVPERLDSVVHAAGVVDLAPVADIDQAQWRRQLDVNLTAPALLTQALLPALRAARGTVVFVNSGAGLAAQASWAAYAASKFGLRALADSLRAEEAEHGIRVTSVFPGRTATAMQEKVHQQESREYDARQWTQPGTVAEAILGVLDLPRDATIAELVLKPG